MVDNVPSIDIDPYSDEVLKDPFPYYELLRTAGPIVRVRQSEGYDLMAIGRDSVVRAVYNDHECFSSARGNGVYDIAKGENFRAPAILVENDPPSHTDFRSVMSTVISPRNLRPLRAKFQTAAEDLVDRLLEIETFDAQPELAAAFPLRVVPEAIMGIDEGADERLLAYSTYLFESMGPLTLRVR